MKSLPLALLALAYTAVVSAAPAAEPPARSHAPPGAEVYIISPVDGATVDPTFTVRFGLKGLGVAPAGTVRDNTGHHHLFIDVTEPLVDNQPIPADLHHLHYGGGQTEVNVTLGAGDHTLQLDFGDASHIQFDPPLLSKKITVHVKAPDGPKFPEPKPAPTPAKADKK